MHTTNIFRFIALLLGLVFLMACGVTSAETARVHRLLETSPKGYVLYNTFSSGLSLKEGETHEYVIPVNAGRMLGIIAQTSVDPAAPRPFEQILIRPDGKLIASDTVSGTNVSFAATTETTFMGSSYYWNIFQVTAPMTGTWKVRIRAFTNLHLYASATLDSDISLQTTLDKPSYELGQPVTLTASLVNATISSTVNLTQSVITATTTIDGKEQILTLLDSGELGDTHAGDGIYTALFTLPNRLYAEANSPRQLAFHINAQNNSQSVLREAQISAPIDPTLGAFTGDIREQTRDEDGDGWLDALIVSATLDLKHEGVVPTTGRLISTKAPSVTIASASASTSNAFGKQEIAFVFRGSHIRAANIDGPYQFIVESELVRAPISPTQSTQSYQAQQFDLVTNILEYDIANGEDFGVDLDGDGLFDELHIKLKLRNVGSGMGWAHVYLMDSAKYFGSYYILPAGFISPEQTIELIFQGVDIREQKKNGPYLIELTWVAPVTQSKLIPISLNPSSTIENYGEVQHASAYIPYATQPYSYTQFDQPEIENIKLGEIVSMTFTSLYQTKKFSVTPKGDGTLYIETTFENSLEYWVQQEGEESSGQRYCEFIGGVATNQCWFIGLDTQKPYFLYFRSSPFLEPFDPAYSLNTTSFYTVTLSTGKPPE